MTKLERLVTILTGSFLVWIGITCIGKGRAYRGVPLPGITGYLLSAGGMGVIVCGLVTKSIAKRADGYLICSECRSVFPAGNVRDAACPKCSGRMEDLKGFYERHPELKDNNHGK